MSMHGGNASPTTDLKVVNGSGGGGDQTPHPLVSFANEVDLTTSVLHGNSCEMNRRAGRTFASGYVVAK